MPPLVHAVGHVKINTSVAEAVVREATEILGLHVTSSDQSQTWLSSNGRAAEVVLLRSSENSVHTIGLEALTREAVRRRRPGSKVRAAEFSRANQAWTAWGPA